MPEQVLDQSGDRGGFPEFPAQVSQSALTVFEPSIFIPPRKIRQK